MTEKRHSTIQLTKPMTNETDFGAPAKLASPAIKGKIGEARPANNTHTIEEAKANGFYSIEAYEYFLKTETRAKPRKPLFACLECGKKFYSARAAEKASFGDSGCPKCGGSDIDVYNGD